MTDGFPLSCLLPDKLDDVADQVRGQMCGDQKVEKMDLAWDYVGKEIHGALRAVLDCDLLGVIAKGWAGAAVLAEFADPAKHPPGERSMIELGEQAFKRGFEPMIGVSIAGCPCVELKFKLEVTGHLGGVKLTVLDGHVVGGQLGPSWASGELSYAGVALHPKSETRKLEIPSAFSFKAPGIAIPKIPSLSAVSA